MVTVNSYLLFQAGAPDCAATVLLGFAATVWKDAAARVVVACEDGGASRELHPRLITCSPFFFTSKYSAPGIAAAKRAPSSGESTDSAVARAPASAGVGATTVELMISSAGIPVRGSTMCE